MSVTSGRTSPQQFAEYDPDSSSWRTWPAIGLWGSTPYSGIWPRCGMTRDGRAYELPTWAHPISGNGCSSLLPTPRTSDTNGSGRHGNGGPDLRTVAAELLPTPRAQNGEERNQNIWSRDLSEPQNLENALARLPLGARTNPLSDDGNTSPGELPLHLPNQDPEADSD